MTDRRGPHTLLMQDFVDALRECMGKDPLCVTPNEPQRSTA